MVDWASMKGILTVTNWKMQTTQAQLYYFWTKMINIYIYIFNIIKIINVVMLLKLQPCIFITQQSTIGNYVSRAVYMGFNENWNWRMLVHVIHSISSLSYKTFRRALELIICFGFSLNECLQMFRSSPTLLRTSEKKLKAAMEFLLHTVMLPKSVLFISQVL